MTLGGQNFRLDLAYRAERIYIEGEWFGVHSTGWRSKGDRARQNKLVVADWLPLLFTWRQARHSEDEVAQEVRAALVMRRQAS